MTVIPKHVIRTGSKRHIENPLVHAACQKLRRDNPDWTFLQFDDQECDHFMSLHFGGEVYEAYRKINPTYGVARADLFRYCAMYTFGGLYLDIKSSATNKLEELIHRSDRYLLSQWDNRPGENHYGWGIHPELGAIAGGEFQQWFIAAEAHSPILEKVIQRVCSNIYSFPNSTAHQSGKNAVLQLTGPIPYTLAIASMISQKLIANDRDFRYISSRDQGLVYSIFEINDRAHIYKLTGEQFTAQELLRFSQMHSQLHYGMVKAPIVE